VRERGIRVDAEAPGFRHGARVTYECRAPPHLVTDGMITYLCTRQKQTIRQTRKHVSTKSRKHKSTQAPKHAHKQSYMQNSPQHIPKSKAAMMSKMTWPYHWEADVGLAHIVRRVENFDGDLEPGTHSCSMTVCS